VLGKFNLTREIFKLVGRNIQTCGEKYSNLWGEIFKLVGRNIQTCGEKYSNLWGNIDTSPQV